MGISNSKTERCEALRLCKKRKKLIKKVIDYTYDFVAAHLAYVQSLGNIGIVLRRFVEAQILLESCSSPTQIPTHSSPAPAQPSLSFMRYVVSNSVTVSLNPSNIDINSRVYVNDVDSMRFTPPLPPPPSPESASSSSLDYFDPTHENQSFRFDGFRVNFNDMSVHQFHVKDSDLNEGFLTPPEFLKNDQIKEINSEAKTLQVDNGTDFATRDLICRNAQSESNKDTYLTDEGEREDFITHRAKDFLSSIKEIETQFFSASECGKEVSRMLEDHKIRVGYSEAHKGMLHFASYFKFNFVCF